MSRKTPYSRNSDKDLQPMQQGLLMALNSLDRQLLRSVNQQSDARAQKEGSGKMTAIEEKVGIISSFLRQSFEQNGTSVDTMLIMARSFASAFTDIVAQVGTEALGNVRSGRCQQAADDIATQANYLKEILSPLGPRN